MSFTKKNEEELRVAELKALRLLMGPVRVGEDEFRKIK